MTVFRSLTAQFSAAAAVLTLVVVALAGLAVALQMDARDRSAVDQELSDRLHRVDADTEKMLAAPTRAGNDEYGDLLAGSGSLVRLISGTEIVAERGASLSVPPPVPGADGLSTVTVDGQGWRSLVTESSSTPSVRLQALQSLAPLDARLNANGWLVAWVSAGSAALAAVAGWFVGRAVLRPLERLRIAARPIRLDREVPERLPEVRRPREVADLSGTLNEMLDRLHGSNLAARRFTADAGHELRTPLASLGAYLEILERNPGLDADRRVEIVEDAIAEHARMASLLDGLQRLARGDARALPPSDDVLVQELLDDRLIAARRRNPRVDFRAGSRAEVTVRGWRDGLQSAVDNLLDNAAHHGRPRGIVIVDLVRDGSAVTITVSDDGPGIPEDSRDLLRQRFARGKGPRSAGSGLGLALVEQQAELHGGRLVLATSDAGGLAASIVIPVG